LPCGARIQRHGQPAHARRGSVNELCADGWLANDERRPSSVADRRRWPGPPGPADRAVPFHTDAGTPVPWLTVVTPAGARRGGRQDTAAPTGGRLRHPVIVPSVTVTLVGSTTSAAHRAGVDENDGMPQLRVALAQVNTCVGDLDWGSPRRHGSTVERRKAAEAGAPRGGGAVPRDGAGPAIPLGGTPGLRPSFRRTPPGAPLGELAERLVPHGRLRGTVAGLRRGYLTATTQAAHAAAVLHQGQVVAPARSRSIPAHLGVDEYRIFKGRQDS